MRVLRHAVAVLAMACLWAGQTSAQETRLNAEQTRQFALQALQAGRPDVTLQITDALLTRDPNDLAALVMRSRALRATGDMEGAIEAGKKAYKLSDTDDSSYGSALVTAQALASSGHRTRAQWWLRRAAEYAPDDAARDSAIRDYNYVRSRNPLAFSFNLSAAPSSNINNGSSALTQGVFDLEGSSRALSGMEYAIGGTMRYRFHESKTARTDITLLTQGITYSMSSKAKRIAPKAKGSDYAYGVIEVGLDHIRKAGETSALSFGATLGHNWYGGDSLSNYARGETGLIWRIGERTHGRAEFQLERQWRQDGKGMDATIATLDLAATRTLANRDSLRFGVNLRDSSSKASWIDHQAAGVRLDWARATPIKGVLIGAGAGFEYRDYKNSLYSHDGRRDRRGTIYLSAAFADFDYMGFIPKLELKGARTGSNIPLYRRRELGISFGIRSAF